MPWVTQKLQGRPGPVVAVSDYMRQVQDQILNWVPGDFVSLGADGFGFSDTRAAARRFFHIDGPSIVVRTLQMLAKRGEIDPSCAGEGSAVGRLGDGRSEGGPAERGWARRIPLCSGCAIWQAFVGRWRREGQRVSTAPGAADRASSMGFEPGVVVQELGWDSDVDEQLRDEI